MIERLTERTIGKKYLIGFSIVAAGSVAMAAYGQQYGFSYKEVIVALGALIGAVIVFGGERGIRFGFVLWVLTLALGYRTIEWTKDLRIHPSEILLWVLFFCIFAQRKLIATSKLSLPWWLWLSLPFWALAWWPLIAGDAPWDKMLNEFRDFLLLVPLMIVAAVVLQHRRYWRHLLLAFFVASTWIALMGVVEYWFPEITKYFPAFVGNAKPVATADNFARAQFSSWGGAAATFICVLALPIGIVLGSWWSLWSQRMAILGGAILQILAIYIGGYRSVWLVLLIQILIACLLGLRKRGVILAMLLLVIAIGGYQFVPNTHERVVTGIAALRGNPIDHSALDRQNRAFEAIDQAITTPLGSGWASAGWVHSDFLQIAANVGILAAFIFIGGYINTLNRITRSALWHYRARARDDLGLALLLAFIAVGAMLLMEGVEVLPQMALPVWFVWVLVEVWLRQTSEVRETSEVDAPSYSEQYGLIPATSFLQSKARV